MHIDDTLPGTDDREFVAGMTGTGKTTFIMKQLEAKKKENGIHSLLSLTAGNNGIVKRSYQRMAYRSRDLYDMILVFPLKLRVEQNLMD